MKTKKQILALLLCFAMVVAMIPVAALQTNATSGVTYLVNESFINADNLTAVDGVGWTSVNGEIATVDGLSVFNVQGGGQFIYAFNEAITSNYVLKFKYKLDGVGLDGTSVSERFQFYVGTAANQGSSQIYADMFGSQDRITIVEPSSVKTNNYIKVNNVQQTAQWHEVEFHVNPTAGTYQLYIDSTQYGADYSFFAKAGEGTKLFRFMPNSSSANFNMSIDYVQVYTVPDNSIPGATATYLNDGFDTLHPKWNNAAATVADGVITTNAASPDLSWTFPTAITGNYTVEFKYRLDAVGTDGTAKQEAFALKMGSTTGQSNSQVYLSFTGALDGASNQDRVKIQTAPGMTPKQFGTYGAWHKVKIVVDQEANTYQLTVDGDLKEFKTSDDEVTTNIPLFNTAITELKTLFFDCDSVSNISLDYLRVYSGTATAEPDESVTEPEETEPEETTVPEETEPEETVPEETVPQISGTKTHLNENYDSETDGIATFDATTSWNFDGITDNYTVEFKYRLGGDAQEVYYVKIGNKPSSGEAKSHTVVTLTGALTDASLEDRVKINNQQTVYYTNNKGYGLWHTVKIVVDQTAKTYQLYLDGVLQTYNSSTNIPYYGSGDTSCMSEIFFQRSSGSLELDYVKVYTENANITQQATLGENIHMNLNGSVSSYSGIISVQAEIGGRTVTDNDMSDGFALPITVAPAEAAETITLTGKNAAGETVISKTYTVADYLAEVKATDEATYGSIVDYTLNYAAAAAAYFGKTAVTAPENLTMEDVPAPAVDGVDVTATTTLVYTFPAVTENYTLEFKYQVPSGSKARVYVSNGSPSSATAQALLTITGAAETDASGDRFTLNHSSVTGQFGTADARTFGQWHTIKLVVDQVNDTCIAYLDGSTEPMSKVANFYTSYYSKANPESVNRITFTSDSSNPYTISIDDVKFTVGETEILNDDFSTFAPVSAVAEGSWSTSDATKVTHNTVEKNPVSGFCAGINIKGATLLVKDRIEVRYYPVLSDGSIGDYSFSINGTSVTPAQKSNGDYYVVSNGINPQDYDQDLVLTITKGDQAVSVAYNPMDYICRMHSKTENATLKALLQAMYNYHLSAVEYVSAAG